MGTASLVKLSVINVSLDGMEHSAISLVVGRKRLRRLMMTMSLAYTTMIRILTQRFSRVLLLLLASLTSPPVRRDSMWEVIRS